MNKSITGITTDELNKYVITIAMDGKIRILDFFKLDLVQTITVEDSCALSHLTTTSNIFC